jgi:hypothetical protein
MIATPKLRPSGKSPRTYRGGGQPNVRAACQIPSDTGLNTVRCKEAVSTLTGLFAFRLNRNVKH